MGIHERVPERDTHEVVQLRLELQIDVDRWVGGNDDQPGDVFMIGGESDRNLAGPDGWHKRLRGGWIG
jgi:hypothetical protein